MTRPTLITNQDGNTLLAALRAAMPEAPARVAPGMAEAPAALPEVMMATAFLTAAGLAAVAPQLEAAGGVRLLLGAEPLPEAWRPLRRPGDPPPAAFEGREVADGIRRLEDGLRRARDAQPFSAETLRQRRAAVRLLRSGSTETRLYDRGFLHAKATLLDGLDPGIIVGSSNLTRAGLSTNLELNVGVWDSGVFAQARAWFDALWNGAKPYDLAAIFAEPEAEYPPWLIFLRVLWQLYGAELDQEVRDVGELPLTAFQKAGVWRAMGILREFGGVIVADEVGLGKTFIAGEIMRAAVGRFQDVLLICPAALRDTTWRRFLREHKLIRRVEARSFEELAADRQFHHPERRPNATREVLDRDVRDYALVVVDEAHNYRNPDAPTRAAVLKRLLAGQKKGVVLLTATPVNNSLWDLYHLMSFFLKQDGALAARGVPNFRARFREAAATDPASLSPDLLYPVIDAVTVKRTRAFVKRHYRNSEIRGADGVVRPVLFPRAVALTVRYPLDAAAAGLFDAVAEALDPAGGERAVSFARYRAAAFRKRHDAEEEAAAESAAGLIRSGLLKRFESSVEAIRLSLARLLREHDAFLAALDRGAVIGTAFLRELAEDEGGLEDLLETSDHVEPASAFDVPALRMAVERDRAILTALAERAAALDGADPKLGKIVEELAGIAAEARADAAMAEEERRNRKVLIFSHYADTVAWLRRALAERIAADDRLAAYRGRIAAAAGGGVEGEEASRNAAVWGFAPESSSPPPGQADLYDILIATDVLAEGMNLQQCRHIINYDLPWNPMRLVQRHGRVDRIGSPHPRVYLRTVFPADRLDALLSLEARIKRKLAQAARSIGVATSPVQGSDAGEQVFAETRAEIERLAAGDASLFEGGREAATGEEYRQRLRAALAAGRDAIVNLPYGAGSGVLRGRRTGVAFCAEVALTEGPRTFLRFVPAASGWRPAQDGRVEREIGTLLRLMDCPDEAPRHMPPALEGEGIFAFWDAARADILAEWEDLSDPATTQPRIGRLNREVAAFLRARPPPETDPAKLARALDVLESPWPARETALLRAEFRDRSGTSGARSQRLVEWVLETGLERYEAPPPLPPIAAEEIRLVCWLAVAAADQPGTT